MKILIASGIYPPDIGGPAQYARNLFETWKKQGHQVKVAAFRWERAAPPGIRHLIYMNKIMRKGWNADLILVLDTWSAAVPTMLACRMMGKRYVIRTGGDFLWETYVERTGDPVLFKDFYVKKGACEDDPSVRHLGSAAKHVSSAGILPKALSEKLSRKERLIFRWGGSALRNAAAVIFSTDWQMSIFERAYGLDHKKSFLVENFCGEREAPAEPENRMFVAGTRPLKWKNVELLKEAFADARAALGRRGLPDIELDTGKAVYDSFVEKIRRSYAVILASLGDISPNLIFDAIRVGTPFLLTKETGITERVKECAVFIDPKDPKDIADKVVWMADPANRAAQAEKVRRFAFVHTWEEIGSEIVGVWKRVRKQRKRDPLN